MVKFFSGKLFGAEKEDHKNDYLTIFSAMSIIKVESKRVVFGKPRASSLFLYPALYSGVGESYKVT